jgi:hypothetical protein
LSCGKSEGPAAGSSEKIETNKETTSAPVEKPETVSLEGVWSAESANGKRIVWTFSGQDTISISIDGFRMSGVYTADLSRNPGQLDFTIESGGQKLVTKCILEKKSADEFKVYTSSAAPDKRPDTFPDERSDQAKDILVFKRK